MAIQPRRILAPLLEFQPGSSLTFNDEAKLASWLGEMLSSLAYSASEDLFVDFGKLTTDGYSSIPQNLLDIGQRPPEAMRCLEGHYGSRLIRY